MICLEKILIAGYSVFALRPSPYPLEMAFADFYSSGYALFRFTCMNIFLEKFVTDHFSKPGTALDLGAGKFFDVACMRQLGWECDGVDLNMGVDLEMLYKVKEEYYDLVYSNYVVHKLKERKNFFDTIYTALKPGGWFFIHTFDASDENSTSKLTEEILKTELEKRGFVNIQSMVFDFYDNDLGHHHWHKILQVTGKK